MILFKIHVIPEFRGIFSKLPSLLAQKQKLILVTRKLAKKHMRTAIKVHIKKPMMKKLMNQ